MPQKQRLPPLQETYDKDDKNPFGANRSFDLLLNFFENVRVVYGNAQSLEQDSANINQKGDHSLYMIIANRIYFPEEDGEWLLNYVKNGNDLFISANEIDSRFLNLFECETNQKLAHLEDRWGNMKETRSSIYFGDDLPVISYRYYYYPFNEFLKKYQKDNTRILGVNEKSLPNFVIIFIGKGRLYLHLAPRTFSNYFLLTGNNIQYLQHVFNYLRSDPSAVYWDAYYKKVKPFMPDKDKTDKKFNSLNVIMKHPLLKWAFWIAAAAFLFFIYSNVKRKQRPIPIAPEPTNASVDFVDTMGRLYFVNKNNKNIASKLITYFREFVNRKYFIPGSEDQENYAMKLSAKRGISLPQVNELLHCIRQSENSETVSDEELLYLNRQLEKFYKRK